MEALRYKLFPLYLAGDAAPQEANDESIVYTRHITNLKPFSCFPERLPKGRKNFDVYPRDKERPIFPERITPLYRFPDLSPVYLRTRLCFAGARRTYTQQKAFADFTRISRNSRAEEERAEELSEERSAYARVYRRGYTKLGSHLAVDEST